MKKNYSFTLDPKVYEYIKREAEKAQRTVSDWLNLHLEKKINN